MNKNELIDAVAAHSGLSKADSGRAVDAVVGSITGALKAGESVNLIGFGHFDVRDRAARTGRKQSTGEADRKSVVSGKSVSGRLDSGGGRLIKNKKENNKQ